MPIFLQLIHTEDLLHQDKEDQCIPPELIIEAFHNRTPLFSRFHPGNWVNFRIGWVESLATDVRGNNVTRTNRTLSHVTINSWLHIMIVIFFLFKVGFQMGIGINIVHLQNASNERLLMRAHLFGFDQLGCTFRLVALREPRRIFNFVRRRLVHVEVCVSPTKPKQIQQHRDDQQHVNHSNNNDDDYNGCVGRRSGGQSGVAW